MTDFRAFISKPYPTSGFDFVASPAQKSRIEGVGCNETKPENHKRIPCQYLSLSISLHAKPPEPEDTSGQGGGMARQLSIS
jgi:hypothetical protein